ncbi:NAD(P)-dependent dehydrogenase (short-subunit alcohol dehydrogenase family) [Constrictibacter sp. MBR-5]|jgi:NAD(P)-dependent dehydrogenase (short-subunit alcohol dehydrogenase family)|uniref:SDR family NAD(P)-dependent oxidoreductase n=1 Tax=Constrictibacter sp. MBR-5 TaxID=3156467 RepID=UPI00339AF6FD
MIPSQSPILFPQGGIAVVVGAGGGIGAALLHGLEARGDFARVVGCGRTAAIGLDLLEESSIAAAAAQLRDLGELRLVIDATGFLHGGGFTPEKSLRDLDPAHLAHAFAVNAIGPALLMKHLLPLLPRRGKAVFATLSARVGSIGDNRLGGWYAYRASKAALNQLVRTAAVELHRRCPEAACVALHPGTVDTGLSGPFAKGGLDVQAPDEAAGRLLSVIDRLGPSDNGGFFDHRGAAVPW